ncbi:MAG: hypothetical protein ACYS8X_05655 [Planctomycetota bacterium]|jgi:hypothetical protein
MTRLTLASLCAVALLIGLSSCAAPDGRIDAASAPDHTELANRQIHESSGLAASQLSDEVFWTHNDSGDVPRLFALGREGEDLATCAIAGAEHTDWEDMASYRLDGVSYLLIADIGDNAKRRPTCKLYIVREPMVDPTDRRKRITAPVAMTVEFRYANGPRDCEAIAVDPAEHTIYLIDKHVTPICSLYALPLPDETPAEPLTAEPVAAMFLPSVTGMAFSSDGRRAIVATYGHAYEYRRTADENWPKAFSRSPRSIAVPARRQGEAICYDPRGKGIVLTSEYVPAPLLFVPVGD